MNSKNPLHFLFLMVFAMMIFGLSWVSGKSLSAVASPTLLTFWRFVISATALLIPFLWELSRKNKKVRFSAKGIMWTALAAIMVSSYNHLFFLGLSHGLAGKGGLIVTTVNPLMTYLIHSAVSKRVPKRRALVGLVLGVIGGITLIEPWRYESGALLQSGNGAFLGAALCWSLLTIASKKAQESSSIHQFNFLLYAIATATNIPLLIAEGNFFPHNADTFFWVHLIFLGAIVSAFATGIYFTASHKLGAAKASAFTFMVPASALLFSALFLGESLTLQIVIGGVLGATAVIIINRPQKESL